MYEELENGGAFDDGNIARSNLFLSVHDAILFAQQTSGERGASSKVGCIILLYRTNPFHSITNTSCLTFPLLLGIYGEI